MQQHRLTDYIQLLKCVGFNSENLSLTCQLLTLFPPNWSLWKLNFVSLLQEKEERYLMLFPNVLVMLSASPRMSGFIYQVNYSAVFPFLSGSRFFLKNTQCFRNALSAASVAMHGTLQTSHLRHWALCPLASLSGKTAADGHHRHKTRGGLRERTLCLWHHRFAPTPLHNLRVALICWAGLLPGGLIMCRYAAEMSELKGPRCISSVSGERDCGLETLTLRR